MRRVHGGRELQRDSSDFGFLSFLESSKSDLVNNKVYIFHRTLQVTMMVEGLRLTCLPGKGGQG